MVTLKNINKQEQEELFFIREIYENSFPADERRDFDKVVGLVSDEPKFHLLLIEKEEKRVGFISYWQWTDIAYVEHFAIDGNCRGGGLGAETLKLLIKQIGLPVVLEVEHPEDHFSQRRIIFYQRLGFTLHPEHTYIQPPYDPSKNALPMLLMTHGLEAFGPEAFGKVRRKLYTDVYQVREAGES